MLSTGRIARSTGQPDKLVPTETIVFSLIQSLILQKFKDFDFGEFHLDSIHLSQRGVFEANGQYHCAFEVPLP